MRSAAGLLILSLAALPAAAAVPALPPVDEAAKDPGFLSFRQRLQATIKARDATRLMAVVDPHIRVSFGAAEGARAFRTEWRPERRDSRIWPVLGTLLGLGGAFREGGKEFWAPYVYTQWPDNIDAFEHAAVIAREVAARTRPAASAPVAAMLSYHIVKRAQEAPIAGPDAPAWIRVHLPAGGTGFVIREALRSPVDYRACFRRVGKDWRLVLLVAGD